jgi:hypothetical protein
MSWSINLSGPPQVVTHELSDAILLLDKALDYSQGSDKDTVAVHLGGYVSWNEDGEVTNSAVSLSFSESNKVPSS